MSSAIDPPARAMLDTKTRPRGSLPGLRRALVLASIAFAAFAVLVGSFARFASAGPRDGGPPDAAIVQSGASDSGPGPEVSDGGAADASGSSDPCAQGDRVITEYERLYRAPSGAGPGTSGALDDADGAADALAYAVADAAAPRQPTPLLFEHLIAIVPDPVESGYTDDFDSILDGVELAVAEGDAAGRRYVRDRAWLPWRPVKSGGAKCWRSRPGVIVYRPLSDAASARPVLVLVVGETPTIGVNVRQLEAALDLVRKKQAWGDRPAHEYRFVGPTFSGTAPSMAAVLGEHRRAHPGDAATFSIVSGTATHADVGDRLRDGVASAGLSARHGDREREDVCYSLVAPNDEALLCALLDYICERGGDCDPSVKDKNIVLLTESRTTFGVMERGAPDGGTCSAQPYDDIKFPPNLGGTHGATSASAPSSKPPDPSAAVSSSEDTTTLADEAPDPRSLAFGAMLRGLSQRRVRFVGLAATDARDVIFLATRIHEQLPDVRLFTLTADLRFLDASEARFLNGMLVAHGVPSLGDEADTSPSSAAPASLQNELTRSVFSAGRRLLRGQAREGDGCCARAPQGGVGDIEISIVGNGAFWQVGPDRLARTSSPEPPVSWWFLQWFFAIAFVACAVLVASPWIGTVVDRHDPNAKDRISFLRHRGSVWAHVGWCEHDDLRAEDRIVTAAFLMVAMGPAGIMLVSRAARSGDEPQVAGTTASLVVAGVLLAALLVFVVSCFFRKTKPDAMTVTLGLLASASSVLALGLGCGPQRDATFNLMSGASPVVSGLIGLGILCLGLWCWRSRLRFLDMHRFGARADAPLFEDVRPPIAEALGDLGVEGSGEGGGAAIDGLGTGLAQIERRLLHVLQDPWRGFPAVPIVVHALLVTSIVVPFVIKEPQTFERGTRRVLLEVFGCLAFLPIAGAYSRLLATWLAFHQLLRRLAHEVDLDALRRLPASLGRRLEAQLGMSGHDVIDLRVPVQALGRAAEATPSLQPAYERCKALLDEELRYDAGTIRGGVEPVRAGRADLVEELLRTSSILRRGRGTYAPAVQATRDDFVASIVAVFVPRYVRHFRLFMPPLVLGSVLATLMTSLYFLQPERLVASFIFVWVAAFVLTIFVVYVALDRDPVISAIGKTTAGDVTWDWAFLRRVVSWGVVPMGSLLAAQYPQFASWIASAFDVIAKGFR